MKKNILEIYALAVCFVAVIGFVVCLSTVGFSLVQIAKPDLTMNSYRYDEFQNNDVYWAEHYRYKSCPDENKKEPRPSEEELTRQRQKDLDRVLARERHEGVQSLVQTLIVMLIDGTTFFIHWLIAKRARAS